MERLNHLFSKIAFLYCCTNTEDTYIYIYLGDIYKTILIKNILVDLVLYLLSQITDLYSSLYFIMENRLLTVIDLAFRWLFGSM